MFLVDLVIYMYNVYRQQDVRPKEKERMRKNSRIKLRIYDWNTSVQTTEPQIPDLLTYSDQV